MGAKESPSMVKARDLILNHGYTAYRAAQEAGITRGAISKSQWYRDHIATKRKEGRRYVDKH